LGIPLPVLLSNINEKEEEEEEEEV